MGKKQPWRIIAVSMILMVSSLFLLAGCGSSQQVSAPGGSAKAAASGPRKIVIGLSNSLYGTDWRTQEINDAQTVFDAAKKNGLIANDSQLKIEHSGTDTNLQIQQIRNMINQKVNVIMVNPLSATALNGVINEAKQAGIPVIAFDQAVTNPYAYNVTIDHYQWGKTYAQWLATALHGKGKIVMMDGLAGNPAAEARKKAAEDVFKNYPGIEILAKTYGGWDEAKAQSIMSNLLATYPEINGVFVEDAMAMGVLRAFETAKRPLPVMTGEGLVGYLKMWKALNDKGQNFVTFAQANPPGISGSGMQVAIRVALGKKLKPQPNNTFFYPISKKIDNSNFDSVYKSVMNKPDTYTLDEWLTDKQADALFQ